MRAFITGSHKYGTPNKNSDLDLVILVSKEDADLLRKEAKEAKRLPKLAQAGAPDPVMFGKLNLIICTDEKTYLSWVAGTADLKEKSEHQEITRDYAVEHFTQLRRLLRLPNCSDSKKPEKEKKGDSDVD